MRKHIHAPSVLTHAETYTHTHTHTYIYIYIYTHTHIHTHTHTHTHTHIYIYIYTHTHIHTHTHTHTHTQEEEDEGEEEERITSSEFRKSCLQPFSWYSCYVGLLHRHHLENKAWDITNRILIVKSQYVNELHTKQVCVRWNFLFNLIGAVGSSETKG